MCSVEKEVVDLNPKIEHKVPGFQGNDISLWKISILNQNLVRRKEMLWMQFSLLPVAGVAEHLVVMLGY